MAGTGGSGVGAGGTMGSEAEGDPGGEKLGREGCAFEHEIDHM